MWETLKHILKFTADGQLITPSWGEEDSIFLNVYSIAIDGNDNVYIADQSQVRHCRYRPEQNDIVCYDYYRIRKFTSAGIFVTQFGDVDTNGNPIDFSGDGEIDLSVL